ncbi:ArsR/SmtB family transcription factor [Chitinimonas naiadis]
MTAEQLAALRNAAGSAAALLKALANEDRLLLLCQLVEGEKSVSQLEAASGIRQPTLSQQLGVLRSENLVATRRDGKFIHYHLASAETRRVLALMYELYCPPGQQGAADAH